jgi:hypothetical protein
MRKILFFIFYCFVCAVKSYAQTNPSDKEIMDSLLKNDEMLKMINDIGKRSSYVRINIGIGNKLYSGNNKSIESLENNKQLIVSPSVEYHHKSGFGIGFTGYLGSDNNKTNFFQYALSPSYNYTRGKIADASISYTHYFITNIYNSNSSPIQDDFYGSILFKKPLLKPGIAAGYSSGKYHEIISIDTTVKIVNQEIHINYTDSLVIDLSSISVAGSVEHEFDFYNLFSKKDGLSFTPQVILISGINKYTVHHNSSLSNYTSFTKKRIRRLRHFQSQDSNKYELQSLGLDLDLNYSIGKFYIEPELYFDYYLPNTNDNRFTQIFNFNIGITF